jgi:hypothetical protein
MKANGVLSLEIDEQERGLVELRVICPRRAWPDKDPATSNQGSLQITYPLIKRSVGEISSRKNWSAPLNVELSLSKVELCNYPLLGIFRELGSSHLPSSSLVQKHSQTHSRDGGDISPTHYSAESLQFFSRGINSLGSLLMHHLDCKFRQLPSPRPKANEWRRLDMMDQ